MTSIRRVAQLRSFEQFSQHLTDLGVTLPVDADLHSGPDSPLAQPYEYRDRVIGNRFAAHPMEGWDGTADGFPTDLTRRRWRRFGESGAKLIWGGEAVAVQPDARANPHQLMISDDTAEALAGLRHELLTAHEAAHGRADDLLIGLQLTHSGRYARPVVGQGPTAKILYHHPLLDSLGGLSADYPVLTDDEIRAIIDRYVKAAVLAHQIGFDFVDLKHCHGYLGHEFLTAYDRPGPYGGSFENRTRFLRELVEGIRSAAPGLDLGVRLSAFDFGPFRPGEDGRGQPAYETPYRYAFGGDGSGQGMDLDEPAAFLDLLGSLDIRLVNLTAGSPYYVPHIQRPALFPPSDGYQPPEDPLVGAARQITSTAQLKARFPDLAVVGTGYSYLQDWLPNVAQAVIRLGMADFVGLGRMMLSYPTLPADVITGRALDRKAICRTFSDCTTAPRAGLRSGCYPLDPFYKDFEDHEPLKAAKAGLKKE